MLRIDVRELIAFYDDRSEARLHANAIKAVAGEELGLALLVEYFHRSGAEASLLDIRCNTGKRKGPRLDGWVHVSRRDEDIFYQVEVKTWSFHSIGGRPLPLDCSPEQLAHFRRDRWREYWSGTGFRDPKLNKVLTPMNAPSNASVIQPLACLWSALHPDGSSDPFFEVPVPDGHFRSVWIFSMSSFLRGLKETHLDLNLPFTQERLGWLEKLFAVGRPQSTNETFG